MPIPKPKRNEEKDKFISRCMSDDVMVSEYKEDQRMAICQTAWKDRNKKISKSEEKQDDTINLMSDFKYFVRLEKAYEEKGEWYVQGIASGTMIDVEGEQVSKEALQQFVDGLPLPLTDDHAKGNILAEVGEVVEASITDDNSLFIKARLDKENPSVPYLVKKIGDGKKFAFSVQGAVRKVKTVFNEKLKKFVREYVDVIPEAISITTRPAYMASFLEVLAKSCEKAQKDNLIQEQKMEKVIEEKEEKIEKDEAVEQNVTIQEEVETAEEADDTVENQEAIESEEEEKSETEEEKKEDTEEKPIETPQKEKSKQEEEEKPSESAEEKPEETQEDKVTLLSQKIDTLTEIVNRIAGGEPMKPVEQKPLSPIEEALQIIKDQKKLVKSLSSRVEILEKLPLQKKTKARLPDLSKSEQEETQPMSIKDVAEKLV